MIFNDIILFITGFSFASWLTANSVIKTVPLISTVTAKLMSDTSIAAYLEEPSCDQTGSTYSGAIDGIKNGKIFSSCILIDNQNKFSGTD